MLWSVIIIVMGITCIVGFGEVLIDMLDEAIYRVRGRARKTAKGLEDSHNRHEETLKRIDELERELQVGKYDPDRIALGFDDTEQRPEPKPLDPEVDALPMPDAVEADEGCPCAACRSKRRAETSEELVDRLLAELNEAKPKPVDDSWADVDVRGGVYGPETRGLVKRIVDSRGNWTEIRSFGS